jgi:signal transduction histidine kinase
VLTGLKELRDTAPAFDDYQASVFRIVCSSAEATLQLVKDLHDLARLDEGALPLAPVPLDLAALVHGSLERAKRPAHVALIRDVPDDPALVLVDETRANQIVEAVLTHALQKARATVRAQVQPASWPAGPVRVVLEDDRANVPVAVLEAPFRGESQDTRPGGAGLALCVARRLVEAHGGHLTVEVPESGGARFVIELPGAHER